MAIQIDLKLKPCPFCGSEDIEVIDNSTDDEEDYILQCNGCDTAVIASNECMPEDLVGLIRHWNRRVNDGR